MKCFFKKIFSLFTNVFSDPPLSKEALDDIQRRNATLEKREKLSPEEMRDLFDPDHEWEQEILDDFFSSFLAFRIDTGYLRPGDRFDNELFFQKVSLQKNAKKTFMEYFVGAFFLHGYQSKMGRIPGFDDISKLTIGEMMDEVKKILWNLGLMQNTQFSNTQCPLNDQGIMP